MEAPSASVLSRRAAAFILSRMVAALCTAATTVLVARMLPRTDYGSFVLIAGLVGVLVVVSDAGLSGSLTRFVAEGRLPARVTLQALVVRIAVVSALLAAAGVTLLVVRGTSDAASWTLLAVVGVLLLTQCTASFVHAMLPALDRFRLLLGVTILQPLAELVATIAAALAGAPLWAYLLAPAAGATVVTTLAIHASLATRVRAGEEPVAIGAVVQYSLPLLSVWFAFAAFTYVDLAIVAAFHGRDEVAPFGLVLKLVAFLGLPGLAIATIVAPRLSLRSPRAAATHAAFLRTLLVGYVGMAVICATLAPWIFDAVAPAYRSSWELLAATAPYVVVLGVAPLVSMTVNYLGGATRRVAIAWGALAGNVALDLVLVPALGAPGAIIGTTLAFGGYTWAHARIVGGLLGPGALPPARIAGVARVCVAAALASAVARAVVELPAPDLIALLFAGVVAAGMFVAYAFGIAPVRRMLRRTGAGGGAAKLRVLHVIDTLAGEGAQHVAVQVACGLDPARHVSTVVATRRSGPLAANLTANGVPLVLLERRSRFDLRTLVQLRRLIASHDVVHAHMFGSIASVAVAGVALPTRFVAHDHNQVAELSTLERVGMRFVVAPRVDRVLAVSAQVALELERSGVAPRRIEVLQNAVPDSPLLERTAARRLLGIPGHGGEVVGCIAALRPEKRHEVLLEAFAAVPPDATGHWPLLVLVGDGTERATLEGRVVQLGVDERVVFAGAVTGAQQLLRAFDLFVLASRTEGSPLALLEAMAAGVPAVATAVGSIPELLGDDRGILVAPDDAAALTAAIRLSLGDRSGAGARSAAAASWVRRERSYAAFLARVAGSYDG